MNKIYIDKPDASSETYLLTEIFYNNGDKINKGDIIAEVETTKTILEIECLFDGIIYYVHTENQKNSFSEPVAIIFDSINKYSDYCKKNKVREENNAPKRNLNSYILTKAAQEYAQHNNIDLDKLELEGLIKKSDIVNHSKLNKNIDYEKKFNFIFHEIEKPLILVGPGTGGDSIMEALSNAGYQLAIVVGPTLDNFNYNPILHFKSDEHFFSILKSKDVNNEPLRCFVNTGTNRKKMKRIINNYKKINLKFVNAIHPNVIISPTSLIGEGNYIGPNTVIGPGSKIGNYNWIASMVNIDHHNTIGDYNLIGPGVNYSGNCSIGDLNIIGAGVAFEYKIDIGDGNIIKTGEAIDSESKHNILLK